MDPESAPTSPTSEEKDPWFPGLQSPGQFELKLEEEAEPVN